MITEGELKLKCFLFFTGLTYDQILGMKSDFESSLDRCPTDISISVPDFGVAGMRIVITSSGNRVRLGTPGFGTIMDFPRHTPVSPVEASREIPF
jgi:hypothetical protein